MRTTAIWAVAACLVPVAVSAETLATVGNRGIERRDVEGRVKTVLFEIENSRYEALRDGLDELVAEALLEQEADSRGVTVVALLEKEVEQKTEAPTQEEVLALYEANKEDLGNAPLEEVRPRLLAYLTRAGYAGRQQQFLDEIEKKYPTKVQLRPPTIEVGIGSRAVRGKADAPITIVEFSDYECPFCRRAEPTVRKVLDTYGDKVRFAYRDFPLDFHPGARPAAEAGHCANAQGKFWEYHQKLMEGGDLASENLKALAGELGLDRSKFDKCLDSHEFKAAVDRDIAAANDAGVSGTPAFFVNGRLLDGAQPFERFQAVIEEELEWGKR